jgi:hypothetical protein
VTTELLERPEQKDEFKPIKIAWFTGSMRERDLKRGRCKYYFVSRFAMSPPLQGETTLLMRHCVAHGVALANGKRKLFEDLTPTLEGKTLVEAVFDNFGYKVMWGGA